MQVIDSTKNKIRELDIVVLLILHQTKHRKAIEGLLRNKIRCGMIHEELVQSTFHSYAQVNQLTSSMFCCHYVVDGGR